MKKTLIIPTLSILAAMGIGLSVGTVVLNNNVGAADQQVTVVKRVTSTDQVERAQKFFEEEEKALEFEYELPEEYQKDLYSSDIYAVKRASTKAWIESGDYAEKKLVGKIIDTVKRAGYLPSNYSYDNGYSYEDSKAYNGYLIAICNTLNDGSFTMTEEEENRLIGQLAFAYHYGHASGDTLKAIENTIIPG